jgi:hypothetical protein
VLFAVDSGWIVGWGLGAVVVVIAAALLLIIIGLGRRIVRQADDITSALDGGREHTAPLFDVTRTNFALDRITRGLRAVRTGEYETPERFETNPPESEGPAKGVEAAARMSPLAITTGEAILAWIGVTLLLVVALVVLALLNRVVRPALEIDRYAEDILQAGVGIAKNLDDVDQLAKTHELGGAVPGLAVAYLEKVKAS